MSVCTYDWLRWLSSTSAVLDQHMSGITMNIALLENNKKTGILKLLRSQSPVLASTRFSLNTRTCRRHYPRCRGSSSCSTPRPTWSSRHHLRFGRQPYRGWCWRRMCPLLFLRFILLIVIIISLSLSLIEDNNDFTGTVHDWQACCSWCSGRRLPRASG